MMKLAYRVYIVTLILLTFVFAISAQDVPDNARSDKDDRNTAPTVGTGGPVGGPTGLFTVYDGQTLRRGEFTFSAAYSNFDRDPGNVDITEVPVSFQVGLTNHLELFFNTDAYRAVKVNSPRNLSSFYLPNSQLFINNGLTSGPAIIQGPTGGLFGNAAVFRPTGGQPFAQFPYTGASTGGFGFIGSPVAGGEGADNFPGVGSVYGSILPGVVLQTACINGTLACPNGAQTPTVFSLAPSYLNDAPFINRTFGESAFNTFTGGLKWRWTGLNNPVGLGMVAYYKWYADNADDFSGFNMLQRGASPGGDMGDIGVTLFADARLRKWVNLSGNVGYVYTSNPKSGDFTLIDRGDELHAAIGVDFPVNKYFQPIFEFRSLQYIGGRTPNAFENHPMDGIAGFRVFPARWVGFGFAYRYHANEQDEGSFDEDETFSSSVFVPCFGTVVPQGEGCVPSTITTSFSGVPRGFQLSENPHGYIIQAFIGRRDKRQAEVVNQFANVTAVTLDSERITIPCPVGFVPREGTTCADDTSIDVRTDATDPENDVLVYNYTVSGGRIVGEGANVSWDVSGLQPGTYTITAGVNDGCGLCGKTETRTITVVECDCVRACECPSLSVTGPGGIVTPGDAMTFTANASGGSQGALTYSWTVSGGTIESGEGSPSISVRTTPDMAGSNVTATVTIGGLDPNCQCTTQASETAQIDTIPQAVMVNEFGRLSNDEIRAQLDNFFADLSNNPNHQGYVINYGTDREITARERLITNHINFRGFDRSRITLVRGGDTGEGPRTRLYRIPPGAENPAP